MSNKDVIFVAEDTASLVMVPVKAVTADLVTEAGVTVYVPLATTENPGVVQIGEGLKITDEGLLSVDISDISAGIVIKHNDVEVNDNATTVNFTNTFNVSVDPDTLEVKIDGSETLNRIVENYDDNYVFLLNAFNNYYDKSYIDNIIVDDLETDSAVKALSAKQGVVLKDLILQVPHARVFDNISSMVSGLNGAGPDAFNVGTTFRLIDLDVPDFWVSGAYDDYQSYEYTTDDVLINAININKKVRIGYYDISKAETEKVVLDDITHEIGELQADVEDLQSQIDDIDLTEYVDRQSVQEISGVKTFVERIGIKNTDGTTDYIKHINNNLLISTSAGTNLLNIDEGLSKIYAFNRELAFKTDIASSGTSVTTNGTPLVTWETNVKADKVSNATANDFAALDVNGNLIDSGVSKNNLYNPNLLINGDFRVNQRGKSEYTTQAYSVDRWWLSEQQKLTVNTDGTITISRTGTTQNRHFIQWIEDYKKLLGKTITISVKVKNATAGTPYKLGIYDKSTTNTIRGTYIGGEEILKTTITIPNDEVTHLGIIFYPNENLVVGTSVTIEYIKAELGDIATPFMPRPYAEELLMCQRYYIRFTEPKYGNGKIATGFIYSSTRAHLAIFLPTQMRTIPTYSSDGTRKLLTVSGYVNYTRLVLDSMTSTILNIYVDATGLTAGQGCFFCFREDKTAYVDFDAEIY